MMGKIFDKVFWKFILVGVINTMVGTAVMFACYNFVGLSYWISSAANYVIGSFVSFYLNKHFTFKNTEKGIKPILRFIINITICYLIAYGIAKPLVSGILSEEPRNIQENGAMLVGMVLFVGLNYLGQRFFAFGNYKNGSVAK